MRLFLDANVLFTAAHNPHGKATLVIELGSQGCWGLFPNPYALEEARRNLERKFSCFLDNFVTLQRGICLVEHRVGFSFPEGLAHKDQPIFQAALACQATHLLTGDLKDFEPFMNQPENTFGICIQTVAEFLNHLG
jgi:predicted nucleic acid-binding protein